MFFFIRFIFFLQFYHLVLNYWSLSYMIFSLFFLLSYLECGLVKLARVNLYFLSQYLFLFNFGLFLLGFSFESQFFFLSWSHVVRGRLVELIKLTQKTFLDFFYDFFSISSFCIKIICPWALSFFHFSFCLIIPRAGWSS